VSLPEPRGQRGDTLLTRLTASGDVEAAFLIDRAGRVIDRSVPWESDRLRQVAALIAAVHAAGVRLAGGGEGPGRARFTLGAGSKGVHLIPLPAPSDLLLVLLLDRQQEARVSEFVRFVLEDVRMGSLPPEFASPKDLLAFEASLEKGLDRPRTDRDVGDEIASPWDP